MRKNTHTRTHKTLLIRAVFRFINEMWRRLMRLAPVNSHIKPREAGPRCEPIAASSATIGSPHPCSPFNFHFSSTRKMKKKEEEKRKKKAKRLINQQSNFSGGISLS